MSRKRVVVIEGEDAAPDAVRATLSVMNHLGPDIEWLHPAVGQAGLSAHGSAFPDEARAAIDASDATLFGATSGASALALFYLRWGKQTYANVRPARFIPGARSPLARPAGIDFIIVRENLEDLYVGSEGELEDLAPLGIGSLTAGRPLHELAPGRYAVKAITLHGTQRVARFAFDLARRRKRQGRPGRVTCGTKHNMLPRTDGFFREQVKLIAADFPDIELQSFIVDDLAHRLVIMPTEFDVVLLPNLYGDILSDEAAALVGGLGLAPSGCYGDGYAYFEPAHGTAPDLAGKNIINPTATLLSAAMMLEHLGFDDAAVRLEAAIGAVYARGEGLTPDQGGRATTIQFCEQVVRWL